VQAIPFNRPQLVGNEHAYIDEALASGKLSGNGEFAARCANWLEERLGAPKALITPSCTAALELAATIIDLDPGDEVIIPSFTFVSTANAFALRGAVPVFVDVRPDTLNIDPDRIEEAITDRTRAIVVVHYGGVACDMRSITRLARRHNLVVIEDAAHALPASYRRRPLGSIGQLATFSFHETKNVHCGEGGALVINDSALIDAAEIAQEKGTNRARFFRGQVDKYTWVGLGSSHLLSEVAAAFLWAQLERTDEITEIRKSIWASYHDAFEQLESEEVFRRPVVPDGCSHSGHLYYLLMPSGEARDDLIAALKDEGVHAVFHYVPLHDSPAGRRLGRASGELPVTSDVSERLLRLPLWAGLRDEDVATVIDAVCRTAPAISLSRSAVSR
jgi:dTDP-4-amino-4,6-dideoxygalactose transaminase